MAVCTAQPPLGARSSCRRRHLRCTAHLSLLTTEEETVAAIVTGMAGGVAIVRLSGAESVSIVRRIFQPGRTGTIAWAAESHRATYGSIVDAAGTAVDEVRWARSQSALLILAQVLVLPMLQPRSYTCEDVVEIHCHGGNICVQRVLSLCLVRRTSTHRPLSA
jgi:tRNA modification GTPase